MEEIGRRLQEAREALGITLPVAEEETKIRRKYLEALEAGRETDIPGDAYLKGFLRTYGNYLRLDGPALVEEYKELKGADTDHVKSTAASAEPTARVAAARPRSAGLDTGSARRVHENRAQSVPRRSQRHKPSGAGRSILMAILVVALAGAVVYAAMQLVPSTGSAPNGTSTQEPGPPPEPQPEPPQPDPTPEPEPEPAPKPEPVVLTLARSVGTERHYEVAGVQGPIEVVITYTAGKPWFAASEIGGANITPVEEGNTMKLVGESVHINIGHVNGVSIAVNGETLTDPAHGGPYLLYIRKP